MTVVLWVVAGVILLAVLIGAVKTGKPVRALAGSALQGICALAAVNAISGLSGVSLGVTAFSLAVCAVLGIPGVAAMLVCQTICIM